LQWPSPSGKNVPARFEGVLKIWNDERGFGFIEPDRGDQEIFVHIKAFAPRSGRPQISQRVSFEVELGTEGKKRAKNVELVQTARSRMASRQPGPEKWGTATLVAIPAFLLLFLAVSIFWKPPLVVALVYVGASLVTLLAYAMDKAAAERGAWRTPESTLHALALAGGLAGRTSRAAVPTAQVEQGGVSLCLLGHGGPERWRVRRAVLARRQDIVGGTIDEGRRKSDQGLVVTARAVCDRGGRRLPNRGMRLG
jgi:cold shock CspA family protein